MVIDCSKNLHPLLLPIIFEKKILQNIFIYLEPFESNGNAKIELFSGQFFGLLGFLLSMWARWTPVRVFIFFAPDKRRRGPFMLPASFLYINWILVFIILLGATAVISMYAAMIAFQGGSALVGKWVVSMIGSIFMSIFLVQPLKVSLCLNFLWLQFQLSNFHINSLNLSMRSSGNHQEVKFSFINEAIRFEISLLLQNSSCLFERNKAEIFPWVRSAVISDVFQKFRLLNKANASKWLPWVFQKLKNVTFVKKNVLKFYLKFDCINYSSALERTENRCKLQFLFSANNILLEFLGFGTSKVPFWW